MKNSGFWEGGIYSAPKKGGINSALPSKIGFFDSGVGGLTVLAEAMRQLPNEHFLYFSDGKNAPYGLKTKEEVEKLFLLAMDFIAAQGVKAIVVACNTATGVAIETARARFDFPIIGMEPAVKPALKICPAKKRVLVLATVLTFQLEKFQKLVARVDLENRVDYLPAQKLVMLAENFQFDDAAVLPYLHEIFDPIDWKKYGAVVLGCTHFPFFEKQIRSLVPPEIQILDGHAGTVRQLKKQLGRRRARKPAALEFYLSGEKMPNAFFERYLKFLVVETNSCFSL